MVDLAKARQSVRVIHPDGRVAFGRLVYWPIRGRQRNGSCPKVLLLSGAFIRVREEDVLEIVETLPCLTT